MHDLTETENLLLARLGRSGNASRGKRGEARPAQLYSGGVDEAAEVGGEEAAMGEAEGALGLAADQI